MIALKVLRLDHNPLYSLPDSVRDGGVAAVREHLGGSGGGSGGGLLGLRRRAPI